MKRTWGHSSTGIHRCFCAPHSFFFLLGLFRSSHGWVHLFKSAWWDSGESSEMFHLISSHVKFLLKFQPNFLLQAQEMSLILRFIPLNVAIQVIVKYLQRNVLIRFVSSLDNTMKLSRPISLWFGARFCTSWIFSNLNKHATDPVPSSSEKLIHIYSHVFRWCFLAPLCLLWPQNDQLKSCVTFL